MKVFGFHDGAACGYYRILLPLDMMAAGGHEVVTAVGYQRQAEDYPVIVGQRIGNSQAPPLWRRLRQGHTLIYETDDDVWSIDSLNIAAFVQHGEAVKDAIEVCIAAAHLVTVSTEPLAEVLRKHHDNVVVLPNFIDEAVLDMERIHRDNKVVIGWAGGDSHIRDLSSITLQLRRFLSRNPGTEFHNMGTDYRKVLNLPGRFTPWRPNVLDYCREIDFDIGIAPLAHTTFNVSKSHIKALEYGALGIPVIASDEPPYHDYVLDGVTGFLVRNEHEWGRRLYQLVNDRAMREEMGAKAKQHATGFTIQRNWHLWEKAYGGIS